MRDIVAGFALLAFASTAAAAPPAAGPAAAAASAGPGARNCEMHVWADAHVDANVSGIFPGGALAAVEIAPYNAKMKRGNTDVVRLLVTPELLFASLKESNIGQRLGIAPDRFILERDPNSLAAFSKTPTRPDEGCRYGFAFQMVKFEKSAVWGRQLYVYYHITDRTVGPNPRNVHWYNTGKLSTFDPTATDEQVAAVLKDGVRRAVDAIVAKRFPDGAAAAAP